MLLYCLLVVSFFHVISVIGSSSKDNRSKNSTLNDLSDLRGSVPFFLQDSSDRTCLSPMGFTLCDERALWIFAKRTNKGKGNLFSLISMLYSPSPSKMCMAIETKLWGIIKTDNIVMDSCNKPLSQQWNFDFIDKKNMRLSSKDLCMVRGKKSFRNQVSVQKCSLNEYQPIAYHPTGAHDMGFLLKASDGSCFDGNRFIPCQGESIYWGVGIRFYRGEAKRYFHKVDEKESNYCLTKFSSKGVGLRECSNRNALDWSLHDGRLSFQNRHCVARLFDNSTQLIDCRSSNYELIALEIP